MEEETMKVKENGRENESKREEEIINTREHEGEEV